MSKRFVTYRTEDQKAGLVNVDENGVLKTGSSTTEGGSGVSSWNDLTDKPFGEIQTKRPLDGFENFSFYGTAADTWDINEGNVPSFGGGPFQVVLDGIVYENVQLIGDGQPYYRLGSEDFSSYPFFIKFDVEGGTVSKVSVESGGDHTLSVYEITKTVQTIDQKYLPNGVPIVPTTYTNRNALMQSDGTNGWRAQPIYKFTVDLSNDTVISTPSNMPNNYEGMPMYDERGLYNITVKNDGEYLATVTPVCGSFPISDGQTMSWGFQLIAIIPNASNVLEVLTLVCEGSLNDTIVTHTPLFASN